MIPPDGTRTSPHPTSDGVSQAHTPTGSHHSQSQRLSRPHRRATNPPQNGRHRASHSLSDDALRQPHLTHHELGQAPTQARTNHQARPADHDDAHTRTRAPATSSAQRTTKRTTHQHTHHLEHAPTRRRPAQRGGNTPRPTSSRPRSVIGRDIACKLQVSTESRYLTYGRQRSPGIMRNSGVRVQDAALRGRHRLPAL